MAVNYDQDFHSIFIYDESSPTCLRWKHGRRVRGGVLANRRNNGIAGKIGGKDYVTVSIGNSNPHSVKKIVWIMHNGSIPDGYDILHKDGDVYNLAGKKIAKSFSCQKYGEEKAFSLACEWRAKMIEELNQQGAGILIDTDLKGIKMDKAETQRIIANNIALARRYIQHAVELARESGSELFFYENINIAKNQVKGSAVDESIESWESSLDDGWDYSSLLNGVKMNQEQAYEKIYEIMAKVDNLISEAEAIADEAEVDFSWNGPAYGMGGSYLHEASKYSEQGWNSSSSMC